jgi:hypothetical protein
VRTAPSNTGELILPSQSKYDESRRLPYTAFLDRLQRFLTSRDSLLITIGYGYGYGDDHINALLLEALSARRSTHVMALMRSELQETNPLRQWASERANLGVYDPKSATISGRVGEWLLAEPVSDRTAYFMDVGFDSDAVIDPSKPALSGKFRLGDFEKFTKFLTTL